MRKCSLLAWPQPLIWAMRLPTSVIEVIRVMVRRGPLVWMKTEKSRSKLSWRSRVFHSRGLVECCPMWHPRAFGPLPAAWVREGCRHRVRDRASLPWCAIGVHPAFPHSNDAIEIGKTTPQGLVSPSMKAGHLIILSCLSSVVEIWGRAYLAHPAFLATNPVKRLGNRRCPWTPNKTLFRMTVNVAGAYVKQGLEYDRLI
jgi:hypothetical protein